MGESQGMRGGILAEASFHVAPGGTEAAARRPVNEVADSTWLALWLWGAMIGVFVGSIWRWDRLEFHHLGYLDNNWEIKYVHGVFLTYWLLLS